MMACYDPTRVVYNWSRTSASRVKLPDNELQVAHNCPRSKGGSNGFENAQVLSRKENRKKIGQPGHL